MKWNKVIDRDLVFTLLVGLFVIVGIAGLPTLWSPVPETSRKGESKRLEGLPEALSGLPLTLSPPEPPEPVERLLGAYTTSFKTASREERRRNIALGAAKISKTVLEPGKKWSFNDTVGPRTEEEGFKPAPVLVLGEVLPGLGGGICQVSSTVHAAALQTGLEVVERHPHSRPSSYIPHGFDATVNYPEHCWEGEQDPNTCFDLVILNPYDFPITIKAGVSAKDPPTGAEDLTVELWGRGPVAAVETTWKLHSTPPSKKRKRRAWRAGDWAEKKQNGRNGANGSLTLDITWPDGRKEQRVSYSRYKPVDEVWWIGDDWDPDKNPWDD